MNVDDRLSDALTDARTDDRWAVPVRPDALDRVRRGRALRRRRQVVVVSVAGAALVAGVLTAGLSLPRGEQARLGTFASGGVPAGSAVPGISPAFVPEHGRDWLLTPEQADAFVASHSLPSPGPGQGVVASPAPLAAASAELLADVEAADFPLGSVLRREESVGGQPGTAAVHVLLPGGVPVEVFRTQSSSPGRYYDEMTLKANGGTVEIVDIPGTTSAAVLSTAAAYGFPRDTPGNVDADGNGNVRDDVNAVLVMSRGGVSTFWVAPGAVDLAQLRSWSFAAARDSD